MDSDTTLCNNWRFHRGDVDGAEATGFDDGAWETVHLPHTYNADDMFVDMPLDRATAEPVQTSEPYLGPAWYRRTLSVAKPAAGGRLFLHVEAAANHSTVYVDGCSLGGRDGGFLGFRFDITDGLDERDEHVIAVRVDNRYRPGQVPPEHIDWMRYGGLYRPVHLLHKGPAHFAWPGVRLTPELEEDAGRLSVDCVIRETGRTERPVRIEVTLTGPDGSQVARTTVDGTTRPLRETDAWCELNVDAPAPWSPDEPNLYHADIRLCEGETELDRVRMAVGFRNIAFDSDLGFLLNGAPLKLRGVAVHQDYPGLGNACPERFHRRDAELIKQAGMNMVRGSHYPRNERFLDACDELGILVMEEQPYWHGSLRAALGEALIDNGRRQVREMVEQHGNHPCIICWNTVNEIMLTPVVGEPHPDPEERRKQHRLQPDEWPYARRAIRSLSDALHEADWQDRPTVMVVGGGWRANADGGMTEQADIVGYNGGAMGSDLSVEPPYDVLRREDPQRIHVMTEGILNFSEPLRGDWAKELAWWRVGCAHWERIYQRDWFCGGAMWVFADYPANGTYRIRGCMDFARVPYQSYWLFKSWWNPDLMVHICGHWCSGGNAAGEEREVVVFANGDDVELFLNGRSLGSGESTADAYPSIPHAPRVWCVPFEPGELKAVSRRGGEEAVDVRHTAGRPSGIHVETEQDSLRADGQDAAFPVITVVDDQGRRDYLDFRSVTIEVAGAARLAGPSQRNVRAGTAGFAVRAGTQAGEVRVRVRADGLTAGDCTLRAV